MSAGRSMSSILSLSDRRRFPSRVDRSSGNGASWPNRFQWCTHACACAAVSGTVVSQRTRFIGAMLIHPGRPAMITSFGSLFAGHVDLDDEGLEGTPVNERWLPDEYLASVFPKAEAIAKLMDRTGYDTYWLAEHHFQREGYECIPNVLMLALHLCHVTKNIRIGCGFNIAPMWHPIRMAEDYATVDWLTNGRVVFGVGRGYHTREVESFGAPMLDPNANRELFEEQVEIIFKSFNERAFSHQGKH